MRRHQLRTSLNLKLSQRLAMTPSMLQKIELLQLNRMELSELLQQELAENPVLEDTQEGVEAEAAESEQAEADEQEALDDFDYEYFFGEYLTPSQRRLEFERPDDRPSFETFLATSLSLADHLNWQLNLSDVPKDLSEIAYFIIGNINEDGYLTLSTDEISEQLSVAVERVEEALRLVQSLDPPGVACRDLQECLLIQIQLSGLQGSLAEKLVRDHLPSLQTKRYKEIAKDLNCDLQEISEALEAIRAFSPRPGQKYSSGKPAYIQPDVYIYKVDDDYQIVVSDDGMPKLRMNRAYRSLLKANTVSRDTKSFIKERMRSAFELLKSIDHRQQTIYRVCEVIVKQQREFLDRGIMSLKPMLLKDVAEELEVHSSTISRVVNNKYAHTPQGIFELRKLFTMGVEGDTGENISIPSVKEKIRKIIEDESPQKPLSDQKISRLLNRDGIQITRRTVAKYRDQMNIAGSRDRKMALMF
ncbi:MAG: RNA polymerase factor sigma-54 [Acidobacteriota bacterium]